MIAELIISFREGFEAFLLVAILVTFLKKTGRERDLKYAYAGGILAVIAGLVAGGFVLTFYGGLEEDIKGLFEGLASYIAVIVLTYMIFWMASKDVKGEVEEEASTKGALGLAVISFIFVVREAFETVLFITPFAVRDGSSALSGVVAGLALASLLSYIIMKTGYRLSLKKFFFITSVLLVLIAGGLAGYGTHEMVEFAEEKGFDNPLFDQAYNLGISESSIYHNKGLIGSVFAVMFGYTVSAEWIRLIVHALYLIIILPMIIVKYRK